MRVVLADRRELFYRGLAGLLEPEVAVVGQATDGLGAFEQAQLCLPDVLLMDTDLPVLTGFEVCARVKEALPNVRVLMLSDSGAEADLIASVRAGASGYLLKDSSVREVIDAVNVVANGQSLFSAAVAITMLEQSQAEPSPALPQLTDREMQVLRLVATGGANRDIARDLFISENTVKNHVRNILEKLRLHSRMEAVLYAVRQKLVELPS